MYKHAQTTPRYQQMCPSYDMVNNRYKNDKCVPDLKKLQGALNIQYWLKTESDGRRCVKTGWQSEASLGKELQPFGWQ